MGECYHNITKNVFCRFANIFQLIFKIFPSLYRPFTRRGPFYRNFSDSPQRVFKYSLLLLNFHKNWHGLTYSTLLNSYQVEMQNVLQVIKNFFIISVIVLTSHTRVIVKLNWSDHLIVREVNLRTIRIKWLPVPANIPPPDLGREDTILRARSNCELNKTSLNYKLENLHSITIQLSTKKKKNLNRLRYSETPTWYELL